MPIRWDSKILLIKTEATYGADPVPTGAANAVLATNVQLQPMEGQDVSRELELPWLSGQATIATELHVRLSFRVELVPSGTPGTPPAWGPLLRACGAGEVITPGASVAYNPVTDGHSSTTIHIWIGPTRFMARGSRANATMRFTAQGIPYLEFAFLGLFSQPSDETRPSVALGHSSRQMS